MKTYLVRSDDSEFISVRAKSQRDACRAWLDETSDPQGFNRTLFVERNNVTVPFVWREGEHSDADWIDKRVALKCQMAFDDAIMARMVKAAEIHAEEQEISMSMKVR